MNRDMGNARMKGIVVCLMHGQGFECSTKVVADQLLNFVSGDLERRIFVNVDDAPVIIMLVIKRLPMA